MYRFYLKLRGYHLARIVHHELHDGTMATEAFYTRTADGAEKRILVAAWLSEEQMR